MVEGGDDEAGGDLAPRHRDGQRLDQPFAQPLSARTGLDLQVGAHLLGVGELKGVSGLGNALETIRVGEPTPGVQAANVRKTQAVVGARPRRRPVERIVVDDDEGAIPGDVHVKLEPAGADLHGLGERGDRVFGCERGSSPVSDDAWEVGHGFS